MKLIQSYLGLFSVEGLDSRFFLKILQNTQENYACFQQPMSDIDQDAHLIIREGGNTTKSISCIANYYASETGKSALKEDTCYKRQKKLLGTSLGHNQCSACHIQALEANLKPLDTSSKKRRKSKCLVDPSVFL